MARPSHVPRSKSTSSLPTSTKHSPLVRLLKSLLTLYLLCALSYTTFQLVLAPLASSFPRFRSPSTALAEEQLASSTRRPPRIPALDALGPEIAVRPLPDGTAGEWGGKVAPPKRPLKGAAVDTDEVRAEDAGSLWGEHGKGRAVPSASSPQRAADGSVVPPRAAVEGFDPTLSSLAWHDPSHPLSGHSPDAAALPAGVRHAPQTTEEDFFLNKAFGESLGPNKVVPFYYRAQGPTRADGAEGLGPEKEDITITTLVTSNRFKVFEKLVEHYQGPVSVTIHVSNKPAVLQQMLDDLDKMYNSSPFMSTWVDVHLVVDAFDRQFNMWRNVAKFFARTDYVMMLDVDFWLCTPFRSRILSSPSSMSLLRSGAAAFVVPAFEFTKQSDGVDPTTFPTEKPDLIKLVDQGKIGMFHKSWQPGHGATNYTRYYEVTGDDVYRAQGYTHSYEPYVVFKKEGTPFCDERFIGYGGNKAACLFELYLSGVSYYVLPSDFVIHQSHAYAEQARKHERRYNRKLYADFREETCFRYLDQMVSAGELASPKAKNMLGECKKIKGFTVAANRLAAAYDVTAPF